MFPKNAKIYTKFISENLIFLIILFFVPICIYLFIAAKEPPKTSLKDYDFRFIHNESFGFGERLEYKVGYKFLTAGTGYFQIMPKPVNMYDRECYDIRFEVRSLQSLELIYKVRDSYRTVMDVGGIFPYIFEQHVREGKYSKDFKAEFDQVNNVAYANDTNYNVTPYIHDIVSAFFYVRTQNLRGMRKDSVFILKNFFKDTTHTLGVKIMGRETIEVEAGKFRCILIQPLVKEGGLFKNEGSIFIWLTDDERKIPVKVATKIIIGFVGAELVKYSGTRGPVNAKLN